MAPFQASGKRLHHPEAGRLDFDYIKLGVADNDQLFLIVLLAADDATTAKLPSLPAL